MVLPVRDRSERRWHSAASFESPSNSSAARAARPNDMNPTSEIRSAELLDVTLICDLGGRETKIGRERSSEILRRLMQTSHTPPKENRQPVPSPKQPLPLRRPARQALLFSRHRGVSRAPTRSPERETAACVISTALPARPLACRDGSLGQTFLTAHHLLGAFRLAAWSG